MAYATILKEGTDFNASYSVKDICRNIKGYLQREGFEPEPFSEDIFVRPRDSMFVRLAPTVDNIPSKYAIGDGYFDEPDTKVFRSFYIEIKGKNETEMRQLKEGLERILDTCSLSGQLITAFKLAHARKIARKANKSATPRKSKSLKR